MLSYEYIVFLRRKENKWCETAFSAFTGNRAPFAQKQQHLRKFVSCHEVQHRQELTRNSFNTKSI